jgi:thiol-disulfide isomerase/thioredoxin
MGRLSALIRKPALPLGLACCSALLVACEQSPQPSSVTRERSQAVESSPAGPLPATMPALSATNAAQAPPKPKPARKALCQGQMREGKPLPKLRVSRADGASSALPKQPITSAGRWTWVNFWAAWCAPCKEEIPRLKSWERELSGERLRVSFVSLDDDERQLKQFLASGMLEQTYWLREGKERDDWMAAAELGSDPELPFHLLVDPDNKVRCRIQGAVDDQDLPDLVRLLGAN